MLLARSVIFCEVLDNLMDKNFIFSVKKWLVLDGEILPSWMDNLSCLLDDHKMTSTEKMDDIHLRKNTNVIFETADFASASPAITSR